ncbi:SBBP repeat-containing protein [Desulfonatronum sp. SC1]|uniref:SBBP repeat-containing protein n=1 Tax=Desulfonatronum sp. SC1 TaxID=2109626 RepID=UPI001304EEA0|nr:SBBP repeat-containing protein [Desulfonatronum sp. SC1]
MKIFWLGIILLAGLFIYGPVHASQPSPDDRQSTSEASGLNTEGTLDLLQFTSGGHVIGFGNDSVYVAGLDRVLRVEFVGGRPVQPVAEGEGTTSHGAPPLGTVTYANVWDGVDVAYRAAEGGILESFYYVDYTETGPAVDGIRLRYNRPVSLDERGNLVTAFENGHMAESAPVAWQEVDGEKRFVDASFVLLGEQAVGFALGDHLPGIQVVIDPVLTWNTFLGGAHQDYGLGIALDAGGNVYIVGHGESTWGRPVRPHQGAVSAFVAKLGSSGALQWNTFLGGTGRDYGAGIAVDNSGNVYVTGESLSAWGSPVRPFVGESSAFVAKLNSSGILQWNTFLGGLGVDRGGGITLSGSGYIYIVGSSSATWGAPARDFSGDYDAFVAKLRDDGVLEWNTFLGSDHRDFGYAIAYYGSGTAAVYVAGSSNATWGFPARSHSGGYDAFLARINPLNGALWGNTFLGGSSQDHGYGIALDGLGDVYLTGISLSSWGSPVRGYSSSHDVFVAKVSGNNGMLMWHTFLGGGDYDSGYGIAVRNNNVFITGYSSSSWGRPIRPLAGVVDAFVARIAGNSGALQWHTFLGGSGFDEGRGIAADGKGNVYLTGFSDASWGSPVRGYTATGYDAFAAKLLIRTLTVTANRTTAVPITSSPSGYGGTTDYIKGVANGTTITLTAPATKGAARFDSWSGCDATNQSARTCTVTMNADKPVTANYKGGQPGVLLLLLLDE